MPFGAKTNERPGTRAQARYIRMSPSKAREVLDLVRGRTVAEAEDILALVERDAADVVAKVLASAVANAVANDEQEPEHLYVSACYADEGPTLKRFRPRARGRATTVRKRSCHITVIVSRLSQEEIERAEKALEASGGSGRKQRASASRAARVAKSRQKDTDKAGLSDDETTDDVDANQTDVDQTDVDQTDVDTLDEAPEAAATDEAVNEADEAAADEAAAGENDAAPAVETEATDSDGDAAQDDVEPEDEN